MNSLDATIHTAAARHTALLHELAALDYAPSALAQSSAYLSDLQEQKERADRELALSAKRTEKERAEHIELQKSVGRKWASKLTGRGGKFGERVSKEERCVRRHNRVLWRVKLMNGLHLGSISSRSNKS
jgi:hypothetical protein